MVIDRIAGAALVVTGLLLIVNASDRASDLWRDLVDRGPVGAGLTGPASGPDSIPRSALVQDITGCLQAHRAGIGGHTFSESEAMLNACVDIAERFVGVSPSDSFGWLQVATLRYERDGSGPDAVAALRQAYRTGLHDGSSVRQRLAVALVLFEHLSAEERAMFRSDLQRAAYYRADLSDVSNLALSSTARMRALRVTMRDLPLFEQEQVLAALRTSATGGAAAR
jgi:hypothetical protein